LNIFEKERFSGKYIITLEYKFNGLEKFEFMYYLSEEILNLNNQKITDGDLELICSILEKITYTKIKKIYLEENLITEKGLNLMISFLIKYNEYLGEKKIKNEDNNFLKLNSIYMNKNKISCFDRNCIDDLFLKCKYIKCFDLSDNPFNKNSKENFNFYNFSSESKKNK